LAAPLVSAFASNHFLLSSVRRTATGAASVREGYANALFVSQQSLPVVAIALLRFVRGISLLRHRLSRATVMGEQRKHQSRRSPRGHNSEDEGMNVAHDSATPLLVRKFAFTLVS
jgi:hypothetical protein